MVVVSGGGGEGYGVAEGLESERSSAVSGVLFVGTSAQAAIIGGWRTRVWVGSWWSGKGTSGCRWR